jgi:hypothetical protein
MRERTVHSLKTTSRVVNLPRSLAWHILSYETLCHIRYATHTADAKQNIGASI